MKIFKYTTVLALLHCVLCWIATICLLLYRACYTTAFSAVCLKIGEFFLLLTAWNPIALIAAIINIFICFLTEQKVSKKTKAWAIISPFLVMISWALPIFLLVLFTGGV